MGLSSQESLAVIIKSAEEHGSAERIRRSLERHDRVSASGRGTHELGVGSKSGQMVYPETELPADRPHRSLAVLSEDMVEKRSGSQDWPSALALVEEACGALRQAHERIQALEANTLKMTLYFEARLEAIALQKKNAEVRTAAAEAKVAEAEIWLARIHDILSRDFKRTK